MPGETSGVLMRTSRFAEELAAEDARRIAEQPPEVAAMNGEQPQQLSGPKYVPWRPWYVRFMAKGCSRCGGEPSGWLQRQIQTPKRIMRFVLWTVNLIPRGVSLVRVIMSKEVSSEKFIDRTVVCALCPSLVRRLREKKGVVLEEEFCGACECPKWAL
jgi:hypothetical protein